LVLIGLSLPKNARTTDGSGRSDQSVPSARRRSIPIAGQVGLALMKAV
jgi:hypothetical protein